MTTEKLGSYTALFLREIVHRNGILMETATRRQKQAVVKLHQAGLVERYTFGVQIWYEPTDAGRAALESEET